jgi:malonate transporter
MSSEVFLKLLALMAVVAVGWVAGRMRWLAVGVAGDAGEPSRPMANAALYLFIPALLFRSMAKVDVRALPWSTLVLFFGPALLMVVGTYAWSRRRARRQPLPLASAGVRAVSAGFGNSVQIGLPVAAALFGEAGLAVHVAIVSVHALLLITPVTALVEMDLSRERRAQGLSNGHLGRTVWRMVTATVIHPVVLPVLAGLCWNLLGLPVPWLLDQVLSTLALAVTPVCLLLIGLSLAEHGVGGVWRGALLLGALKMLLLPLLVWGAARLAGLDGLPLQVLVMAAALPTGSNALIFAQRYRTHEAEASATVVLCTFAFGLTAPMWLALLHWAG